MSTSTRFTIGDRVVTPNGIAATVVGNYLTANGVETSIEYTQRSCCSESELAFADPARETTIQRLTSELIAARNGAMEAQARVKAAATTPAKTTPAKSAKKRR